MIPQALLDQARDLAYSSAQEFAVPVMFHMDLAREKGQDLAEKLKADKNIVMVGTLLMDCMIGQAIQENRLFDHIEMSVVRAEELINQFPEVTAEEKQNILMCVRQHHGTDSFYSLESEIVCNADCYRFASCAGLLAAIRYLREMPIGDLVTLANNKVEEKWNALSLDICKEELAEQYEINRKFLNSFKGL